MRLSRWWLDRALSGSSRALSRSARRVHGLLFKLARELLFRPRPDDVFIVGYPKSGSTLMQMMLYQLTTDGSVDFPHLETVSPWYDMAVVTGEALALERSPSPRLLKSHALYAQLPRAGKAVYVARDVRDVAVSAFHHACLFDGFDHELGTFLDEFLRDRLPFGSWFEHVASWWPHRLDDRVLFLLFDDVISDLEGAARRVAAFCGLDLTAERLARTVARCDIAFMRQHDEKLDPRRRRITSTPEEPFAIQLEPGRAAGSWNDRQEELLSERLRDLAEELAIPDDDPDARLLRPRAPGATRKADAEEPERGRGGGGKLRFRWLSAELRVAGLAHARISAVHDALARKVARDFLCSPRPDDVYVAAHPGSGYALVLMMLYQLLTDGGMDDIPHIESFSPWYDRVVHFGEAARLAGRPSPRVFFTHLPRRHLPRPGKLIYLFRDPRDAAAASFDRHRLVYGVDGNREVFVEQFLTRRHLVFGSWFDHTRSWWPHRRDEDVLFLVYEEVVAELETALRRIADFCAVTVDESRLPRIVERCRIEVLQEHSEKFDPRLRRLEPAAPKAFIRHGRSGDGNDVLDPGQEALIGRRLRSLARRLRVSGDDPAARLFLAGRTPAAAPEEVG